LFMSSGKLPGSSRRRNRKPARHSDALTSIWKNTSAHRATSKFQVLADQYGNVEVLGERDCSIQRRHQKLLEESPSPVLEDNLRNKVSDQLRSALAAARYSNAGTVEFLMDEQGDLYFIEVNARINVEHPVTELVSGVDLVKSQILIAQGKRLTDLFDAPVQMRGHAIECRIPPFTPIGWFRLVTTPLSQNSSRLAATEQRRSAG